MSKKSKKKGGVSMFDEEVPKKSNFLNEGDFIDKNNMDQTKFLCFLPEDYINYNISDSPELIILFKKMYIDYRALLTLPFNEFWSTLSYNPSLKKSLDSFLRFSRRRIFNPYKNSVQKQLNQFQEHENDGEDNQNQVVMYQKEILRIIFFIYHRMIFAEKEDKNLSARFETYNITYDNWLLDLPKLYDLISLYGQTNRQTLTQMILMIFKQYPDFLKDFSESINKCQSQLLESYIQMIIEMNRKSKFEDTVVKSDIDQKVNVLIINLDLTKTLSDIFDYFPYSCIEHVLLNIQLLQHLENLYYHLQMSLKMWKLGDYQEYIHLMIKQIFINLTKFFVRYLDYFQQCFERGKINDKNWSKFVKIVNYFLSDFGKVLYFGKKDEKCFNLLDQILKHFDLVRFFKNLPTTCNIDKEKFELFQVIVNSIIDDRSEKRKKLKRILDLQNGQTLTDQEDDEKKQIQEEPELSENEQDTEIKVEQPLIAQEKIKVQLIQSKKNQQHTNLELSEKEKKKMIKQIKNQMQFQFDEYNDDYDDTLESYQDLQTRKLKFDQQKDEDFLSSSTSSSGSDEEDFDQKKDDNKFKNQFNQLNKKEQITTQQQSQQNKQIAKKKKSQDVQFYQDYDDDPSIDPRKIQQQPIRKDSSIHSNNDNIDDEVLRGQQSSRGTNIRGRGGATTGRGGYKKFMEKDEINFDMTNRDAIYQEEIKQKTKQQKKEKYDQLQKQQEEEKLQQQKKEQLIQEQKQKQLIKESQSKEQQLIKEQQQKETQQLNTQPQKEQTKVSYQHGWDYKDDQQQNNDAHYEEAIISQKQQKYKGELRNQEFDQNKNYKQKSYNQKPDQYPDHSNYQTESYYDDKNYQRKKKYDEQDTRHQDTYNKQKEVLQKQEQQKEQKPAEPKIDLFEVRKDDWDMVVNKKVQPLTEEEIQKIEEESKKAIEKQKQLEKQYQQQLQQEEREKQIVRERQLVQQYGDFDEDELRKAIEESIRVAKEAGIEPEVDLNKKNKVDELKNKEENSIQDQKQHGNQNYKYGTRNSGGYQQGQTSKYSNYRQNYSREENYHNSYHNRQDYHYYDSSSSNANKKKQQPHQQQDHYGNQSSNKNFKQQQPQQIKQTQNKQMKEKQKEDQQKIFDQQTKLLKDELNSWDF